MLAGAWLAGLFQLWFCLGNIVEKLCGAPDPALRGWGCVGLVTAAASVWEGSAWATSPGALSPLNPCAEPQ